MRILSLFVNVPKVALRLLFRPELKSALLRVLRRAAVVGVAAFLGDLVSGMQSLPVNTDLERLIVMLVVAALAGAADKVAREWKRG